MSDFTGSKPTLHEPDTRIASLRERIVSMRLHNAHCARCGSILDAPRVNPGTGELGRKCGDCARWQPPRDDRLAQARSWALSSRR